MITNPIQVLEKRASIVEMKGLAKEAKQNKEVQDAICKLMETNRWSDVVTR